jgi:Ni/Co efflux regulator RcnB
MGIALPPVPKSLPERMRRVKPRTGIAKRRAFSLRLRQIAWNPAAGPDILLASATKPDSRENMMRQIARIACGSLAAAALSACVVVPGHRPPPPAYGPVEYRTAPPPPAPARIEVRFEDHQRRLAHEYYRHEYHDRGRCPPGLERKHHGCERPGHVKWQRGRPLPHDVHVRAVPRDLELRIGPAPRGYRYVEVAGDILMVAVGTAVVVDALQDLNR